MITDKQKEELDKLLGECVRLSNNIELSINLIYCFVKTKDTPVLLQDENFNVYGNEKFTKLEKEAENANFDTSLKELERHDKNNRYFTVSQYQTLNIIRKNRNSIIHEIRCPYYGWKNFDEDALKEFQNDIRKIKSFISMGKQYEEVIAKALKKMCDASNIKITDCIKIVSVENFIFKK